MSHSPTNSALVSQDALKIGALTIAGLATQANGMILFALTLEPMVAFGAVAGVFLCGLATILALFSLAFLFSSPQRAQLSRETGASAAAQASPDVNVAPTPSPAPDAPRLPPIDESERLELEAYRDEARALGRGFVSPPSPRF